VVRHGQADGVEVAAPDQFAEIVVRGAALAAVVAVDGALGGVAVVLVDVADGDELDLGVAEETPHVAGAHAADADGAHDGAVARRGGAVGAPGRRGDDGGPDEGGPGADQRAPEKAAAGERTSCVHRTSPVSWRGNDPAARCALPP